MLCDIFTVIIGKNFAQKQQLLIMNMAQPMQVWAPVKGKVAEMKTDINTVKGGKSMLATDFEELKNESQRSKNTLTEHQRFLSLLDVESRNINVIIAGVSEERILQWCN